MFPQREGDYFLYPYILWGSGIHIPGRTVGSSFYSYLVLVVPGLLRRLQSKGHFTEPRVLTGVEIILTAPCVLTGRV